MDDFSGISVAKLPGNRISVVNPTHYALIGQGAQGVVLKISESRCVKVYAENTDVKMEYSSYQAVENSSIAPIIFEKGTNYLIMEYLKGPSLDEYLQGKGMMPPWVPGQVLHVLKKMKQCRFTRIDSALRHIFVVENHHLKIIDLVHALTIIEPFPSILLREIRDLRLLEAFLRQVKELDPWTCREWEKHPQFRLL